MTDRQTWKHATEQLPLVNPRQRKVLDLIVAGHTNQEIADRLGITLSGAKWHVSELLSLFGFFSREEMAEFWASRPSTRRFGWPNLGALPLRGLLGTGAASLIVVAIAVPWLMLRASTPDVPLADPTAAPPGAATLAPSQSVASEQLPVPAPGPGGLLAYLNVKGDLVVKPMPVGSPQVVRHANGLRSPRWSASGKYLALVEQGVLVVLDAPGKIIRVAEVDNDRTWAWSPSDDELAVFTSDGMWLFYPATGASRVLRAQGSPLPEHPSAVLWSPDGTQLLYQLSWSVGAPGRDQTSEMRVFDLASGRDRLLLSEQSPPLGGTSPVGWSSDGEWVYFRESPIYSASGWVDGVPLMAMQVAGGETFQLGTLLSVDGLFDAGAGHKIAFIDGSGRFAAESEKRLAVADGGALSSVPGGESDRWAAEAAWSPDGNEIAAVEMPAPTERAAGGPAALDAYMGRKLWLRGSFGTEQLTSDPEYRDEHPVWAKDGQSILFVRIDKDGHSSIWVVPRGGGKPTQVVGDTEPGIRGLFGTYGWMEWSSLMDWWQP